MTEASARPTFQLLVTCGGVERCGTCALVIPSHCRFPARRFPAMKHATVAALVLLVGGPTVSAQSLGDLAKKTAADREKAKATTVKDPKDEKSAPAKVYTEDDLKK